MVSNTSLPTPHIIQPTAVYFVDDARTLLRLRASSLRREIRLGRLRVTKRCGRYYILGKWLIDWIESGELAKRQSQCAQEAK